jgi:hypothetical protein
MTKDRAIELRTDGKSFREISAELGIPLSTAHLWTRAVRLTDHQKKAIELRHFEAFNNGRKIAQKTNSERVLKVRQHLIGEGKNNIGFLSRRELTLVGAALYWSEGFKKDSRLGFANSDPDMINLALRWLYEIGGVNKGDIRLRVGINIHHMSRTEEIQEKWSEITQIPLAQFQKPFYQKTKQEKVYANPENYLGVLRIRANNQGPLFYKILGMIEGLRQSNYEKTNN